MITSEILDLIQRRINSILFRIVLITYAIVILFCYDNYFTNLTYITTFLIYPIVYFSLLKKHKIRLINDYIFIFIILFEKDITENNCFVFTILPIINNINFSGKKKTFLPYLFSTSLILFLYYRRYSNNDYYCFFLLIFPILFLYLINSYTYLRTKVRTFREKMIDIVDSQYTNTEIIRKPFLVYNKIIVTINNHIQDNLIEDLLCFKINKNLNEEKLILINGSSLKWKYNFLNDEFINKIRKNSTILNEQINIDDRIKSYNLSIYINSKNEEYIFIFITRHPIPFYYQLIGFFRTIEPTLWKMVSILQSDIKFQEHKNKELINLSARSQYVNKANKTMHFIRNRLGPFSNLLKMLENSEKIPHDKLVEFNKLISSECKTSKTELTKIIERADDMLEKSNNPFVFNSLKKTKIEDVYTILKRNFLTFFPTHEINSNVNISDIINYTLLNEEGFELFLSDWLNNMRKKHKSFILCEFTLDTNKISIHFKNDYTNTYEEVKEMISDINSKDRNEIMKRSTHGLFTIKNTLEDMDINYNIRFENDENTIVCLSIEIKTYNNESSYI